MSTLLTDTSHVALYDSVSGTAFGPTFDSDDHALDFIRWYVETAADELGYAEDLRVLTAGELLAWHRRWQDARLDEDGFLPVDERLGVDV